MVSTSEIAVIISAAALSLSVLVLWINSLRPFRLKMVHGGATFRLYKITPSMSGDKTGKTWWIPSFDMPVSFHNRGKLSGVVWDIRIRALFKSEWLKFYPLWVVDYGAFQKHRGDRFRWIQEAVTGQWYPVFLTGQEAQHRHLIFEGPRWENGHEGVMTCIIETFAATRNRWIPCCSFLLHVPPQMYETTDSQMVEDTHVGHIRD